MTAPRLPEVIPEGERDVQLTSIAGTMRRYGASPEAVLQALLIENEKRCDPPLPDEQLVKIARSSAKWASSAGEGDLEREAELERLNATYAVRQMENNVVILQEKSDEVFFLNRSGFKLLLQNRYVATPLDASGATKRVPLTDRWLKWEHRREYTALVFEPSAFGEPGVASDPRAYNLWRGWAVEPSAVRGSGRCDLFLKHLRYVVCRDRDHYEWLLDWLATSFKTRGASSGSSWRSAARRVRERRSSATPSRSCSVATRSW